MSPLLKNINELENWWNGLASEWKHFLCVNYLYNCDPLEFKELAKSIMTGNYMEEWLVPFFIPSICHYSIKARTLLDFHTTFSSQDETSLFHLDIEDLDPLKDFTNLESVQFPRTLKKVDCSFLHGLKEIREIKLMSDYVNLVPQILSMRLPRLDKIVLCVSPLNTINQKELRHLYSEYGVELELCSDENDPRVLVDIGY